MSSLGIHRLNFERLNFERPNLVRPNFERPNFERPNFERPNFERPNFERPNFERLNFEKDRTFHDRTSTRTELRKKEEFFLGMYRHLLRRLPRVFRSQGTVWLKHEAEAGRPQTFVSVQTRRRAQVSTFSNIRTAL